MLGLISDPTLATKQNLDLKHQSGWTKSLASRLPLSLVSLFLWSFIVKVSVSYKLSPGFVQTSPSSVQNREEGSCIAQGALSTSACMFLSFSKTFTHVPSAVKLLGPAVRYSNFLMSSLSKSLQRFCCVPKIGTIFSLVSFGSK